MKLGLLVSSKRKNVQKVGTLENIWTKTQYRSTLYHYVQGRHWY